MNQKSSVIQILKSVPWVLTSDRDYAWSGWCAVWCRLYAPHRRGSRGYARQPEWDRGAPDDRRCGHVGHRAPLHSWFHLRHV